MRKNSAKKLFALALAAVIAASPITAFAFTSSSRFTTKTYTHQDRFFNTGIQEGIDVSYHNGRLDWGVIKNAGVDFAIIRAAYRGYGEKGTLVKDTEFANNIMNAQAQGIPVGVYIYSQAITTAEAVQEANYILDIISGYSIDLPVVFDYEFAGVEDGRLDSAWSSGKLNKSKMTDITLAFCDTIKNAGYDAMVYANKSFLNTNIDHTAIENAGYQVWLAHYTTNTNYTGEYKIWQYTSDGSIPGIANKRFDCNFMYSGSLPSSAPRIMPIPNQTYTGYEICPEVKLSYGDYILTEGVDYTTYYQNNVEIGTATVNVVGIGMFSGYIDLKASFNIVAQTVENMRCTSTSSKSANIEWDAVYGATGYIVQILKNGKWTNAGTFADTNATVTGLAVGSLNYIHIAAYTNVNGKNYVGAYNKHITVSTALGPVNTRVSKYTNSYITLAWDKQTASNGYEIYSYDYTKKKYVLYKTITNGNTGSYKITGLSSNKEYKFKIRAYKLVNGKKTYGSLGNWVLQYTSVKKPTLKSATSPSTKRIKMTWSKVSGATGYQVMWSTYSDFSQNYLTKSVSSKYLSTTLTTAKSKKTYYVKVRAYRTISGKKVYSPWSSKKTLKTK